MGWFIKTPEEKQEKLDDQLMEALNGSVQDIQKALAKGGKPNMRIMRYVIVARGMDALNALIAGGADVNMADRSGNLLFYTLNSVCADWQEKTQILLKNGARIDGVDLHGDTALMVLAKQARDVQILLDAGADATGTNMFNENALMAAASLRGYYYDAHNAQQTETVVKNITTLSKLIDINQRTQNGNTALMLALPEFKELLISLGADVNIKDNYGQTVLHQLCGADEKYIKKCKKAFETILAKTSVDLPDMNGQTPLILAAKNRNMPNDLFDLMAKHSKDVNKVDKYGRTALMYASLTNQPSKIHSLLKKNALVSLEDNNEKTAIDLAFENETPMDVVSLLESHKETNGVTPQNQVQSSVQSFQIFAEFFNMYVQLDPKNQKEVFDLMRQKISLQNKKLRKENVSLERGE